MILFSMFSISWYFDSGSSRHMVDNRFMLTNCKSYVCGLVTFGDGDKSKIKDIGTIVVNGSTVFNNVLFVV